MLKLRFRLYDGKRITSKEEYESIWFEYICQRVKVALIESIADIYIGSNHGGVIDIIVSIIMEFDFLNHNVGMEMVQCFTKRVLDENELDFVPPNA